MPAETLTNGLCAGTRVSFLREILTPSTQYVAMAAGKRVPIFCGISGVLLPSCDIGSTLGKEQSVKAFYLAKPGNYAEL